MRRTADNPPLAIGAILAAVFALSLGDALIKQSSSSFLIWQVFVLRSCLAIPVLVLALKLATGSGEHCPVAGRWAAQRSLMLVVMWICCYLALAHVPLAAALFTGDRIGRVGWVALFLGFAGVLLILRPASGDLNGAVTVGSVGASIAYQNRPPSVVGTVDSAHVGFAAVWGLVLFEEFPGGVGLLGMALILGPGCSLSAADRRP